MPVIRDRYTPKPFTHSGTEDGNVSLVQWIQGELEEIARSLNSGVQTRQFNPINSEPEKLTDGMVVYADGTDFNPGSGRGLYERKSGAWVKL